MQEVDSDILHAKVLFPASAPFFPDHFPGTPLVPAFVQLAEVRKAVLAWDGNPAARIKVLRVKFLRPISPDQECLLQLKRVAGQRAIAFQLSYLGQEITQGDLRIE